jgi:hypothetical protein
VNHPVTVEQTIDAGKLAQALSLSLNQLGYWFCTGKELATLHFYNQADWSSFSDCWNRLELDHYMGDGGVYRYRRYGNFRYRRTNAELVLQPHSPYSQPSYINTLNGGINRHFEPLEAEFTSNVFLQGLLIWCAQIFGYAADFSGDWDIKLHPYRILAMAHAAGHPTPEGLHRDGVDYILTLMVQRQNVVGGETAITRVSGELLWQQALFAPLDIVIADDVMTKHAVSPIRRVDVDQAGHRDVLVAAFTRH